MSNSPRKRSSPPSQSQNRPLRVLASNRRATFDYDILDTYEAGLVLEGPEIKSLRQGRASLAQAYARPDSGEIWLYNMHIAHYPQAGPFNPSPTRPRKLLLHRWQIIQISSRAMQKGLTLVPLRVYLKGRVAKVALALVRGKRRYEKKQALIEHEMDREAQRAMRRRG